jgi:hypothetical protein
MLTDFLEADYSEDLFWSLTPRQVETHLAATRQRRVREHNERVRQAHLTAQLFHTDPKRMPKVERFLQRDVRQGRRQSQEEMLAVVRVMAATLGGASQ